MNTLDAIQNRRSIRKFKPDSVPKDLIDKILESAIKAPSAMNRQPWRFIVLTGVQKDQLLHKIHNRIAKSKLFKGISHGALTTVAIMQKAPVLILVFNAEKKAGGLIRLFTSVYDVMHLQSLGAAIENMLLAAQELGLGTLWIGHVFLALKEIRTFTKRNQEFIAAVSLGFPDESPKARPRKGLPDVVAWFE
jgi:nitroreductase